MIQNLRVDTIYYLTNSDFEMEFNLCGCCKMRLLTDKAENPKNFIGLLSRAVSRSQVIICCGKLFGDDGLINTVSQAIRKPLVTIDNSAYDIVDDNEIKIIRGSVPLVNSDGCFCGCIIESGPQSIVLLTDNKSIRKTVMKPLIHPYIEELSLVRNAVKNTADTTEESPSNHEENTEQNNVSDETSDQAVETAEDSAKNEITQGSPSESEIGENPEFVPTIEISEQPFKEDNSNVDDTEKTEAESSESDDAQSDDSEDDDDEFKIPSFVAPNKINDGFDLYLVSERQEKKNKYPDTDFMPSNNGFYESDTQYDSHNQKSNKKINISILIITIILLCALAALAYLLVFVPMKSDYVFSEYIKNIFSVSVNIKPLI